MKSLIFALSAFCLLASNVEAAPRISFGVQIGQTWPNYSHYYVHPTPIYRPPVYYYNPPTYVYPPVYTYPYYYQPYYYYRTYP